MNAAFLIMSTAALAGADPAPPAAPPATPVVVSGTGCTNCAPAPTCDSCGKPGLLDRIKAKLGGIGKKSHGCGCAPAPTCEPACAPAPAPAPCHTCHSSIANRPNLLDTLKARCGSKKCGPVCDPCGATAISTGCASALPAGAPPVTTPTTPVAPKEMPKPKEKDLPKPKEKTTGNTSGLPLPPVTGAGATGTSPY